MSVRLPTKAFPADLVDEVIAEGRRTEQRSRTFTPGEFSIGMALNAGGAYKEVSANEIGYLPTPSRPGPRTCTAITSPRRHPSYLHTHIRRPFGWNDEHFRADGTVNSPGSHKHCSSPGKSGEQSDRQTCAGDAATRRSRFLQVPHVDARCHQRRGPIARVKPTLSPRPLATRACPRFG